MFVVIVVVAVVGGGGDTVAVVFEVSTQHCARGNKDSVHEMVKMSRDSQRSVDGQHMVA